MNQYEDIGLDALFTDTDPTRRVKGAKAPVLVIMSARGGVGTSTIAMVAGELAATEGKVNHAMVVDAVSQSNDMRLLLRASDRLPTVQTAISLRDPRKAFIGPDTMNGHRPSSVPIIGFGTVLSPGPGQTSSETPHHYARVIDAVRESVDLVIIDAGQVPPDPTDSKMFTSFLSSLLTTGCWSLVVSDSTQIGLRNAMSLMSSMQAHDIPRDRTLSMVNKVRSSVSADGVAKMTQALGKYSTSVGYVDDDPVEIGDRMELGTIPVDNAQLRIALAQALLRVTGRPSFEPLANATVDRKGRVKEAVVAPQTAASAASQAAQAKGRFPSFGRKKG